MRSGMGERSEGRCHSIPLLAADVTRRCSVDTAPGVRCFDAAALRWLVYLESESLVMAGAEEDEEDR
jgi:hypothetical protein